jgi:hypothetical protein
MLQLWFFTLLALAIGCSTTFANTFTVMVKVVEGDKRPVAKADVAPFWDVESGVMRPTGENAVVTDADGKAVLRVDDWNERRPVLVLSADRTLGAIIGVSKADEGKEVIAALGKTARIKGELQCKELNQKPAGAVTTVTAEGFRAPFAQNMSKSAAFEFVLPAGKYALRIDGADAEPTKKTVTVDHAECDLGTVDLKASPMAKLKGKSLPQWVIADARGVKREVKLSDYKGKWVYIEFWGFW